MGSLFYISCMYEFQQYSHIVTPHTFHWTISTPSKNLSLERQTKEKNQTDQHKQERRKHEQQQQQKKIMLKQK